MIRSGSHARILETGELVWLNQDDHAQPLRQIIGVLEHHGYLVFWLAE